MGWYYLPMDEYGPLPPVYLSLRKGTDTMKTAAFKVDQRVKVKSFLRVHGGDTGVIVEKLYDTHSHTHSICRLRFDNGQMMDFWQGQLEPLTD